MKKLLIVLLLSSCGPIKEFHIELYKKSVYKYCVTDEECEEATKLIYERFYSCNATMYDF